MLYDDILPNHAVRQDISVRDGSRCSTSRTTDKSALLRYG